MDNIKSQTYLEGFRSTEQREKRDYFCLLYLTTMKCNAARGKERIHEIEMRDPPTFLFRMNSTSLQIVTISWN